ncbi:GNAT family N-acetyltransferase [Sphingomonas bacterium]|uniref:GNAT family N-acetyltransferase n=1 Tax=Sphingomonas bacterium TaxID=1895847 RepID=UPI0015757673|nr:GNAT family N-acetyltransferase [Sphingomonas bacterium]
MQIRPATPADVTAITAIYAHHVLHGTGTFEEVPPPPEDMAARLAKVVAAGAPWLIAEDDGGALGFAYAAQFRDRSAYRFTAEDSVYIRHDAIGRGVGTALLDALIEASRAFGYRELLAVIGDSENHGSIALHRRFGFVDAGIIRNVGYKFDRWLDVVFLQLTLSDSPTPR